MTIKQRIDRWILNIKKYIVLYKDGYYIIPYLSNSPEVMIQSLKSMPFTKYNADENVIYTNNIFSKGALYYRELAEGLWIIITEIEFIKDVCTNALYDGEPTDYYFLSHLNFKSQVHSNKINLVKVPTTGWTLYKPGHEATAFYNKGTDGIFTNIIFTKAWAEMNIPFKKMDEKNILKNYFKSEETIVIWEDMQPDSIEKVSKLLSMLKSKEAKNANHLQLTINCLELVNDFLKSAANRNLFHIEKLLSEADRRHLAKAEKMLTDALFKTFPGIDVIAKEVHLSPTKLKNSFKLIYGKPLNQYYQEKQMLLALEMLKSKTTTVKDVAQSLGYENTSNFTAAFKKYHQFLPSEVVNSTFR